MIKYRKMTGGVAAEPGRLPLLPYRHLPYFPVSDTLKGDPIWKREGGFANIKAAWVMELFIQQ